MKKLKQIIAVAGLLALCAMASYCLAESNTFAEKVATTYVKTHSIAEAEAQLKKMEQMQLDSVKRRQKYVESHPELDSATQNKILDGVVSIGMTKEMVVAIMGKPYRINETVTKLGMHEQWIYHIEPFPDDFVYFENDKVSAMQFHR